MVSYNYRRTKQLSRYHSDTTHRMEDDVMLLLFLFAVLSMVFCVSVFYITMKYGK